MDYLVFSQNKMEFRYGSGLTVYSEKLTGGRLICTDYHATGMPQQPVDRITQELVSAFQLEINGQDASFGWSFVDWQKKTASDMRPYAELTLYNEKYGLCLRIETYCGDNGYFTRKMYLKNLSKRDLSITHVSPLSGVLWEDNEEVTLSLKDGDLIPYTVGGFVDDWWGMEGNFAWRDVPFNATLEIGSHTGHSGHGHPFAILHNKVLGGYFVCQLEWSSNWRFRFFNNFRYKAGKGLGYIRLCFDLAPHARSAMRVIDVGEEVAIPPIHFGYTYKDLDGAVQALHEYQRKYILARSPLGYEPSYCAHWGYEGWEMNSERLKKHVDRAAEMGIEMFLVDAGWYGAPDTSWSKTVGDWQDERVPGGLKDIIDYTHKKGLLFGLWIEPEAIGPDSKLHQEHPEWMLQRYGESVERCLDLSKPEVEAWVERNIIDVIERYGIDLIRIDANNESFEGGFNQRGEYTENTHWRNVEAIHRIFDRVRERFPKLLFENCASGGRRTDLGMMHRFSRVQYTDRYKFPRIARIFNGMSLCLPPETLLSMLGTGVSCHKYGNIETQLQLALQGSLYINPFAFNDEPLNDALCKRTREYMDLYKEFIRPIQSECRMYHHTPVVPGFQGRGWVVNEYVSQDRSKAYAMLFRLPDAEKDVWMLRMRGLDRSKSYKVTDFGSGESYFLSGYDLIERGITVRLDGPLTSKMLLFEAQ